jgi:hypothetical protein
MAAKYSLILAHVDEPAPLRLEQICNRHGMTKVEMMSRLIKWFSLQDDKIQTAVLEAMTKGSMAGVAKSVLKSVLGQHLNAAAKSPDHRRLIVP